MRELQFFRGLPCGRTPPHRPPTQEFTFPIRRVSGEKFFKHNMLGVSEEAARASPQVDGSDHKGLIWGGVRTHASYLTSAKAATFC